MRHSPDRGPRDLEVTAAAAELTTSAPAACVRACLRVGGSVSVCARACLVSPCEVDGALAWAGGTCVRVVLCMCRGCVCVSLWEIRGKVTFSVYVSYRCLR